MVWSTSPWDKEQNTLKMVILGHFLPFYPLKTPKIKILKIEKICWRYHHFTCVYQKPQSYDVAMVPEIWSATDRFFCHYGPFFAFLPQKDKILKKWKKHLKIIIILQMFTINNSHIIYGFSDIEYNWQIFFVILDHFCTFTPLKTKKIKILKNWKKHLEISSFHTSVPKIKIYCSLDMARIRFNCYFSFWAIFYPFTALTAQKIKI